MNGISEEAKKYGMEKVDWGSNSLGNPLDFPIFGQLFTRWQPHLAVGELPWVPVLN